MSAFEAVELDVTVRAKIVTYYPSTVVENQVKLRPPHSPTPIPVLAISDAAGAKAIS